MSNWADSQQFHQDARFTVEANGGTVAKVKLLWMTPDPLGAIAALASMYEGKVIRSLDDLTDDDRRKAFANTQKTHLQAPLEAVKLHFLIEGVDRAFTHQLVRQRTAVYAQESMRFAVVDDLENASTLPPSLHGTVPSSEWVGSRAWINATNEESKQQNWRALWDGVIDHVNETYKQLVNDGMPAEEARGLLPHCTATRIQYVTDLRNLVGHAGNRLCTQAQFHWRQVFNGIVDEIRNYQLPEDAKERGWETRWEGGWQFHAIADSNLFKPICYQLGECPFQASFDRACTIRDRVNDYAKLGISSDRWHLGSHYQYRNEDIEPILDHEWKLDPGAARA